MEYHEHLLDVSGILESEEDTLEVGMYQDEEPDNVNE